MQLSFHDEQGILYQKELEAHRIYLPKNVEDTHLRMLYSLWTHRSGQKPQNDQGTFLSFTSG